MLSLKNKIQSLMATIFTGVPTKITEFSTMVPVIDGKPRVDLAGIHDEDILLRQGYEQHLVTGETGLPNVYGRQEVIIRSVVQDGKTIYMSGETIIEI